MSLQNNFLFDSGPGASKRLLDKVNNLLKKSGPLSKQELDLIKKQQEYLNFVESGV